MADYSINSNSYLNNGYQIVSNMSYLSYNYYLYYSNTQSYGNAVIMLAKSINKPFYIDYDNFYLDIDAFNEVFTKIQMENKDDSDKRRRISSDDDDIVLEKLIEVPFDVGEIFLGNLIEILANYEEQKSLRNY